MDNDGVPVRIKGGPTSSTVSIEVAGVDVSRFSQKAVLIAEVGSIVTLDLSMFALDGFDITMPSAVNVTLQPMQEGTMDVTTLGDDMKRYVFVRKAQDE